MSAVLLGVAATIAAPSAARARGPVVIAAGDIACAPGSAVTRETCRHRATSRLILDRDPARVLTLGDNQYEMGTLWEFQNSYAPTWGRFKRKTRPTVGNHEYSASALAAGYFDYFGPRAGPRTKGYYSFDVGRWHLVALNSQIAMGEGSPQVAWLKKDLESHRSQCTLAYWHLPRFSSGDHGNNYSTTALWRTLYAARAELVLSGHDHDYERFAPKGPRGRLRRHRGIRQFVVGTGGKSLRPFGHIKRHSRARNATAFGVLRLRLNAASYEWRFVPVRGSSYRDSGRARCH